MGAGQARKKHAPFGLNAAGGMRDCPARAILDLASSSISANGEADPLPTKEEFGAPTATSTTGAATTIQRAGTVDVTERPAKSKWFRWRRDGKALLAYLLHSEGHTFAFLVA